MTTAALVLVLLSAGATAPAPAGPGHDAGQALFRLGEADEERGDFAQALEHDRACAAAAPGTPWAARASARIDWLLARSEGGFAPLARLERVRRDPALADDPAAVEALARDAEAFPPGVVRVEARMLVAEAWLGRMRRLDDAVSELRRVADDPAADPLTARLAERELVDALLSEGRSGQAAAEARARADRLEPRFVRRVARLAARSWALRAAFAVVASFGALASAALVRARRRRALGAALGALRGVAVTVIAFSAFVAAGGAALAASYESGDARPFLLLGAAVLPVSLVAAAWSEVGSRRPAARVGRAALCGAAVLAAAFAVLDVVSPSYLEGFGL